MTTKLMKNNEVLSKCAVSKSTMYRLIRKGEFPAPVSLTGCRAVAWRADEIETWISNRRKVRLEAKSEG
ncbi:MAG TPA: transcriptional regulator [Pseudohongiella sp.]|nr:transcriptional regulator [Pseudohongiella sp.]MEC8859901.1 AlpA family phage regulatory protein [Pseudomonadota bacterium]HBX37872.1 transcriptional regulator [Pseudohongiella sp.]